MPTLAQPSSRDDRGASFDDLYRAHAAAVARRLRALGVHDAAIEDALQDVFVVAFRRAHTYEARATVREWLLGIARRIASRYRRGHARAARRHDALATVVHAHAQAVEGVEAERRCDLEQMFAALDPERRSVLLLGAVEGRTREELGEVLGVRPTTAYSRLLAARRAATAWLRGRPGDDDRGDDRSRRSAWLGIVLPSRAIGMSLFAIVIVGGIAVATRMVPRDFVVLRSARLDVAEDAPVALSARSGNDPPAAIGVTSSLPAEKTGPAPLLRHATRPVATAPIPRALPPSSDHITAPASTPQASTLEATPAASSLRIELDLLLRARTAVNEGRLQDATALLEEHARRFPASTLTRERERTRDALDRAGSSHSPEVATDTDR